MKIVPNSFQLIDFRNVGFYFYTLKELYLDKNFNQRHPITAPVIPLTAYPEINPTSIEVQVASLRATGPTTVIPVIITLSSACAYNAVVTTPTVICVWRKHNERVAISIPAASHLTRVSLHVLNSV
jgi:hypothetical protein